MSLSREEWEKRKRMKRLTILCAIGILGLIILLLIISAITSLFSDDEEETEKTVYPEPVIEECFLTENPYSRSGEKLASVKGVVVHAAPDPGLSARKNREYYEGLKDQDKVHESVHFIVGIDGEILELLPLDEVSFASGEANENTISIEYCYPVLGGEPTEATYHSMVSLIKWLADRYDFGKDGVKRHYDITGKKCPYYYTENPAKWLTLEEAVERD